MMCQFCKRDPNPIILVPSRQKFGEAIDVFSCRECAIKEGLYCTKHEVPHIGFVGDDSTACVCCIEKEVRTGEKEAKSIYKRLLQGLPQPEWLELKEAAELDGLITGDGNSISVLRFVLTRAHRLHVPVEIVVEQILQEGTATTILPLTLFG